MKSVNLNDNHKLSSDLSGIANSAQPCMKFNLYLPLNGEQKRKKSNERNKK